MTRTSPPGLVAALFAAGALLAAAPAAGQAPDAEAPVDEGEPSAPPGEGEEPAGTSPDTTAGSDVSEDEDGDPAGSEEPAGTPPDTTAGSAVSEDEDGDPAGSDETADGPASGESDAAHLAAGAGGGPEGEAARAGGGEPGAPPAASPGSAPTDEAPSPAAALQIDIHPCVGVVPATVRRVTRIELDSDLELAELTPRDVTRVWVECARDDTIALRVDDPTTGKTVTRRVDLSTTAAMARSRLLALAIAELVSASWIEHRMRRETAVRAVDATAAAPIRRFAGALAGRRLELPAAPTAPGPDRPSRRAKGLLYGLVGAAGRPAHLVGGGAFRVFVDLGERALLATAFEVARGEASAEGRDVLLHRVSLSTTFAFRERFGDLMLAGGVGARVGRALLRGRGAGGTTHVGAFGGAFLAGDALWRWGRLVLGARLEVGTITLPVNGTRAGRALAGLDGGWGTLQLGAGLVL